MTEGTIGNDPVDRKFKAPELLEAIWRNRPAGIAIAACAAIFFSALVALTMPRGPATPAGALAVMAGGLLVGVIAGLAMRSRWAMLLAPAAYWAVVEIAWLGIPGPTVDAIRLDESYGIMALIAGRGFYAIVALLPMALGASLGTWLGRTMAGTAASRSGNKLAAAARWTPTVIVALFLLVLAVQIALPASTPPILGDDGKPVPGSIAELRTVKINGQDQELLIRSHNASNPVLLYLSGGPGQSDLAYPRALFGELEKNFTVVSWDKRGTGYSYSELDPVSTLTFDNAVLDTIEVTNYLRQQFHQDKIYLIGESYGTVLGVKTVQQRPDLYYAYIGSGQMVSPKETDQRLWQDVLDYANRTGDTALAAKMQAYGKPPYKDIYAYTTVMGLYDTLAGPYEVPAEYRQRLNEAGVNPLGAMASEYSLVEKVNLVRGLFDMFSVMYPQLQDIDFRQDTTKLDVPVYILAADHELPARQDLVIEWYGMLDAPQKHMYTMQNAGHAAAFEGVDEFTRIMNEEVLPETYPGR